MRVSVVTHLHTPLASMLVEALQEDDEVSLHDVRDFKRTVPPEAAGTEVLITPWLSAEVAQELTSLRLVLATGKGLDQIDLARLPERVNIVANTGHADSIAEYVFAVTVLLRRQLLQAHEGLRKGYWVSGLPGRTLHGARVVVVGYGEIGKAVASLAHVLGSQVTVIRRRSHSSETAPSHVVVRALDDLSAVLPTANIVVIALPLTDDTFRLFDDARLRQMRTDAIVVNVSRAEIMDERALFNALVADRLGGAALDVWWREPETSGPVFANYPFHTLSNVLMTPHISGHTHRTYAARAAFILQQIDAYRHARQAENWSS